MSKCIEVKKITRCALIKWKYLVIALTCVIFFQFLTEPRIPGILLYLVRHTHANGAYDYVYYPKDDFSGYSYNLIRHSATTYVLASYLHEHPIYTKLFIHRVRESLTFLDRYQVPCAPKIQNSPMCLVISSDPPTLAANAFTIMAFHAVTQLHGITEDEKKSNLQKMIMLEKYLSASFQKNKLVFPPLTDPVSKRYQEGQVLLAWSVLYKATGDISYLQKAQHLRDDILTRLTNEHDYILHHWFWLGLQEYHLITGDSLSQEEFEYLTRAANQALSLQINEKNNLLYGTFTKENSKIIRTDSSDETDDPLDPSSFSVRIEGFGTLLSLLSFNSNKTCAPTELCRNLKEGIHLAAKPFYSAQINFLDILHGFSLKSFGGIPARQKDSMIQIDYLQHALSAYLVIQKYK